MSQLFLYSHFTSVQTALARVGISQLASALKMFGWRYHECISSFPINVGLCAITCPASMISLFLPYLAQWKQHGNIYNFILVQKFTWPIPDDCISSFWNLHASIMYVAKEVRKCVVDISIVFTFGTNHAIHLWLNDFHSMWQKAISGKTLYST